ncbi:MAG TPA: NADP-dependent oxidoreductase [Streptosporangiaceae bacterium]|nr:NADP-dependent oxidoreductase [Streptosporangiaceae bacterium]
MRAVVVRQFGGPEQLELTDLADPVPGPGEVRVAVRAAGVNPVDAGNRADGSWAGLRAPCVLGYDIAGVVDATGPGVTGWAPGDRVMAMTHFRDGAGGYAELCVLPAGLLARLGDSTSFADAAAAPVAGGTALAVLGRLGLPPGGRLLVLGGSGGVGLFLIQVAAAHKIEAIAVGRAAMHEQMRALGAAACIDYTTEDVAQRARELAGGPVDAIADLVGGRSPADALGALRPGGQIAAIASPELDLDPMIDDNITFHGVLIGDDGERTRSLAGLLADGSLRPVISHVLPLASARRAHEIIEDGHPGGKIVLTVAS